VVYYGLFYFCCCYKGYHEVDYSEEELLKKREGTLDLSFELAVNKDRKRD
jgi:hypothetical protein